MWKNQARQLVIAVIGGLTKLGNRFISRKIDQCHLFFFTIQLGIRAIPRGKDQYHLRSAQKTRQQRGQSNILTTPRGMDQCQSLSMNNPSE